MKNYQQLEEPTPVERAYPISGLPLDVIREELRKFYNKKIKQSKKKNNARDI